MENLVDDGPIPEKFRVNIMLDGRELTKDFESKLESETRRIFEGKIYRGTFIKKGIKIVQISEGRRIGSHTTGKITFRVVFWADTLRGLPGSVIHQCLVTKKTSVGILAKKHPYIVILPNELQNKAAITAMENIRDGDFISAVVEGKDIRTETDEIILACKLLQKDVDSDPHQRCMHLPDSEQLSTSSLMVGVGSHIELHPDLGEPSDLIEMVNNTIEKYYEDDDKLSTGPIYSWVLSSNIKSSLEWKISEKDEDINTPRVDYYQLREIIKQFGITPTGHIGLINPLIGAVLNLIRYSNIDSIQLVNYFSDVDHDWENWRLTAQNKITTDRGHKYGKLHKYIYEHANLLEESLEYFDQEVDQKLDLIIAQGDLLRPNAGSISDHATLTTEDNNWTSIDTIPEFVNARMYFSEILFALHSQNKDGTFIMRINGIFSTVTLQLLNIVSKFYRNTYVIATKAGDPYIIENFVVAKGFIGITSSVFNGLKKILQKWNSIEPIVNTNNAKEKYITLNNKVVSISSGDLPVALIEVVKFFNQRSFAYQQSNMNRIKNLDIEELEKDAEKYCTEWKEMFM